jgi:hypothetical protein
MHTERLLSLFGIVSLTFASGFSPLLPRQSINGLYCPPGDKFCGNGCIRLDEICCPDRSGGCPSTTNCQLMSNGKYGCCSKRENCFGRGGAFTLPDVGSLTETFDWFQTELPTATVGTFSEPSIPPATSTTDPTPTPCSQQPGMKSCGGAFQCISESATCCPDGSGSCPSGEYCMLDNSGGYACCQNGQRCDGSAGISSGLGSNPSTTSSTTSTSSSSSSLATGIAAGGGATGPLAVSEMTIFGSFLIGLFPGFLG